MPTISVLPPRAALALVAVLLGGCRASNLVDGYVCTDEFRPGLNVFVKDSVSSAFAAAGASLIVTEGSYRDTASVPLGLTSADSFALHGAGERSGMYDVTVRKAGYRDWTRNGVVVTRNDCHVNTVTLTALLQR